MSNRIKSLEERLLEREKEYANIIKAEELFQDLYDKIIPFLPEDANTQASVYSSSAYLYISLSNVEDFEISCISNISEIIGDAKWDREIESNSINHKARVFLTLEDKDDFTIFLSVSSKPTDSCKIKKMPTGKTHKVTKYVEVEEPEFEYLVECSDD